MNLRKILTIDMKKAVEPCWKKHENKIGEFGFCFGLDHEDPDKITCLTKLFILHGTAVKCSVFAKESDPEWEE